MTSDATSNVPLARTAEFLAAADDLAVRTDAGASFSASADDASILADVERGALTRSAQADDQVPIVSAVEVVKSPTRLLRTYGQQPPLLCDSTTVVVASRLQAHGAGSPIAVHPTLPICDNHDKSSSAVTSEALTSEALVAAESDAKSLSFELDSESDEAGDDRRDVDRSQLESAFADEKSNAESPARDLEDVNDCVPDQPASTEGEPDSHRAGPRRRLRKLRKLSSVESSGTDSDDSSGSHRTADTDRKKRRRATTLGAPEGEKRNKTTFLELLQKDKLLLRGKAVSTGDVLLIIARTQVISALGRPEEVWGTLTLRLTWKRTTTKEHKGSTRSAPLRGSWEVTAAL